MIKNITKHEGSAMSRVLAAGVAVMIAIVVAISVGFHPGVAWAGNDGTDKNMRVNDHCDLLSDSEQSTLSKKIKGLEPKLEFDIVVYVSTNAGTVENAKGYFEHNNFGWGDASDGMILGYNPDTKQCAVYVNGVGSAIFNDSDLKSFEDAFVSTFQSNPMQAVYDFLANSSIKAGSYKGLSVSSEWPNRSGNGGATSSSTSPTILGTNNPEKHTTDELAWYPKNPAAFVEFHNPDAPRVVDNADLLTDDEEASLVAKIKDMESRLGMDFVLYTDTTSYGLSRDLMAKDFYTFNGYGVGDTYSGVIYYVCMEPGNRGFETQACGDAQELMTEANLNHMDDATYSDFKSGAYATAINTEFDNLDILYTNKGFPIDWTPVPVAIFIAFVAALAMASKEVNLLKKKMITVLPARFAREYASSPVYVVKTDNLVDTVVTRTKHYEPSDSGGSSGGRSSYSSGSHASGGSSHSFSGGGRSF